MTSSKELAKKYKASYEATARRLVQKNFRDCMLVVFKQQGRDHTLDSTILPIWTVRYCIASPTFRTRYCEKITGTVPLEAVTAVTTPGHDITASYLTEIGIAKPTTEELRFKGEFFFNTYNIFCLLTPIRESEGQPAE